jgi:hypothetical protein
MDTMSFVSSGNIADFTTFDDGHIIPFSSKNPANANVMELVY